MQPYFWLILDLLLRWSDYYWLYLYLSLLFNLYISCLFILLNIFIFSFILSNSYHVFSTQLVLFAFSCSFCCHRILLGEQNMPVRYFSSIKYIYECYATRLVAKAYGDTTIIISTSRTQVSLYRFYIYLSCSISNYILKFIQYHTLAPFWRSCLRPSHVFSSDIWASTSANLGYVPVVQHESGLLLARLMGQYCFDHWYLSAAARRCKQLAQNR